NVFDVSPDFDSFLAALSTKERRNVRHDERELNAVPGLLRQSIADSDELRKGLDDLVELHGRQWEAQGRLGHFKDWKGIEAFHREFALRLLDRGRLSMQVVSSNAKPLAVEYGGSFGRRLHWIIGARAEGVASRIGFCQLLRSAQREGAAQIDALPGEYDYKRRLGATTLQVKTVAASRRRGASAIRLRAFRAVTRFVSFAYYRLWYWHLAPWLRSKFPWLRSGFLVAGIWPRFVRARFLAGARHASTDEAPSRDDRR
ncbi:MAG: GNAT family N-acetyltransferase, partial [Planctomycetota bacterium]